MSFEWKSLVRKKIENTKVRSLDNAIIICAFAADPTIPSEPTIGWAFVQSAVSAAKRHDLTVVLVTNKRSAEAMALSSESPKDEPALVIVAVGLPQWLSWLERPRINAIARVEYLLWYFRARSAIRKIGRRYNAIMAHHVTFATEMLPSPIVGAGSRTLKVWGPIGSDGVAKVYRIQPTIPGTAREYGIQVVRDKLSQIVAPVLARRVDLVVTSQNGSLQKRLRDCNVQTATFPNLILPPELVSQILERRRGFVPGKPESGDAINIMCVGHLIARKRVELGIAALAEVTLQNAHLDCFGSPTGGDLKPYLDLASRLGVSDRVTFHGSVDRSVVLDYMLTADVLFHPSGREGAVGVIGEATVAGIPVVCFDGTGAALVLRAARGAGVSIDASSDGDVSGVASAIRFAATLDRVEPADWTPERFDEFERLLVDHAVSRHSSRSQDVGAGQVALRELAELLTALS